MIGLPFDQPEVAMCNRVVLNYMVKIKLRAMLSLTLSNNTFLWMIILCQIWVRKINVYR